MRILVTGGGGFLGTHIIKELLKNSSYIVTNFSRHSYSHLEDLGVPTIKGDIRKREDVEKALTQGFDAIFHVAALAGVWGKYEDYYGINYEGTKNLVEVAKSQGIQRFVYTSTPSVVFNKDDLLGVGEEQPYATEFLNAYSETKTMAEKLVLAANDNQNFLTCAIRPHLIWGPGDPHLFPRVIQKGKEGKLKVVGDGENLVDIVFVENAALAHVQAFEHLKPHSRVCGQAYFIGQERPVKLWGFINQILGFVKVDPVMNSIDVTTAYRIGWLLEKVFKVLGIQKPEPPMTRFVALNLGKSHYFSHEKAKRDFGYYPKVSIEEGLKKTFSYRDLIKD
ncbi:NAD-dependent epimerase/dehydratase family protein [Peredibacter starrii]|uniref:NAD-dependent epimerase/dehydratase family protein n=1 Tax=Peredibacter starrii TaxID=28202 RepID=A0AAX4HJH5_9BACT|nr:NAD-dependent epimerase/dehydratase family protein [Peredibacter starrii]WPU63347.1 NAD-dependent epimerase/dehydratase family protein [Peredibacter starrii]